MSKKTLKIYMNMLPLIMVFTVTTAFVRIPKKTPEYTSVAFIGREIGSNRDEKVQALKEFFDGQKSPLADNSDTFVDVAEKYGLDYRLLPAIACMESSCGKRLIPGSYNPFGWGIYGKNAIHFKSFDEAIEIVGKGISEKYVARGLDTPEKIAPVYTPPNPINWKNGVNFFISKIDFPREVDNTILFAS